MYLIFQQFSLAGTLEVLHGWHPEGHCGLFEDLEVGAGSTLGDDKCMQGAFYGECQTY